MATKTDTDEKPAKEPAAPAAKPRSIGDPPPRDTQETTDGQ